MVDQGLDFIANPEARAVVRQMLAAVVDHPTIHRNLFKYQRQHDGTWEYFVGQHHSGPAAFPQYIHLPVNVVDPLRVHGWAVADRSPEFKGGWYRFTAKALDWYRQTSGPTDEQVRAALGRYFFRLAQRYPNDPQPFDAAAIAEELGFEEPRIALQTLFLVGAGVLDDVGPKGAGMPLFYQLSRPDGFRWADSGFGSTASLGSSTVNVQIDVTINITPLLLAVEALAIPEELKREVAEIAEDLQREPTIEKFGKLMELGANVVTLVPPIARFFIDNGPAIQQLLQ